MNRRPVIFSIALILSLGLGLGSCTKKEGPQTTFSRLLGKWKKTKYATDDNGNGKIDPREIYDVESGVDNEIQFNKDSTGTETNTSSPTLSFRWHFIEGPIILLSYNANDTEVYTIAEISSDDLTLTTQTNLGLAWYYYIKR